MTEPPQASSTSPAPPAALDSPAFPAAVFDAAPVGIAVTDPEGILQRVNAALCRATGWRPEQLLARPVTDFLPEAEHEGLRSAVETLLSGTQESVRFDELFRCADGSHVELAATLALVRDADGVVLGRIWWTQDLTRSRIAERAEARALADLADDESEDGLGIWSLDDSTGELTFSRGLRRIMGVAPHERLDIQGLVRRVHPDDREWVVEQIRDARPDRKPFRLEHRLLRDGEVRWLSVRGEPQHDTNGAVVGVGGTVRDVTARALADAARREAEERFRRAFEDAPVGMAIMDVNGRFVQVNDSLARMTGYRRDELTAMSIGQLSHPDYLVEGTAKARGVLRGDSDRYSIEARLLGADGRAVWVECAVSLTRDVYDAPLHFIAHVVDVTERREQAEELQHLATHDPLTGLLNRRAFESELALHAEQSDRYGATGALIVVDIDHFKLVNDTAGHGAGDAVIVRVAEALRNRVRASDVLARLGGDEFAVLLHRADEEEARTLAEALRAAVRSSGGPEWNGRVTTSSGVALFSAFAGHRAADVLAGADLALYAAKEAGRDRVVVHHPSDRDQGRMQARVRWLERIRRALDDNRLLLYAQPIRDLTTGEDNRFELLLRMVDEDGAVVAPNSFLAVAERFGLMSAIDQWVACQAIRILQEQHAAGNPVTLEVNVSGRSMGDPKLLAAIEAELSHRPVRAGGLVIEVTETAAVADLVEAQRFASRLSELGCSFALDDFGAGFGSFYYAKHLPFDYLKIDGEFVRNCRTSHVDRVVIHAVVELARGLGKRTVAEFVQDDESARLLQAAGVDFGQGYHLGRPLPIAEALPAVFGQSA